MEKKAKASTLRFYRIASKHYSEIPISKEIRVIVELTGKKKPGELPQTGLGVHQDL